MTGVRKCKVCGNIIFEDNSLICYSCKKFMELQYEKDKKKKIDQRQMMYCDISRRLREIGEKTCYLFNLCDRKDKGRYKECKNGERRTIKGIKKRS